MAENVFLSGPWTGFYNYTGPEDRHRMDLNLTFAEGRVIGDGIDDVGRFVISGRYDATDHECNWTKTYPGSHDVRYRGFGDSNGIWGTWEIPPWTKGGFHIWPRHSGDGEKATLEATTEKPIEEPVITSTSQKTKG
jgi:hypothetical protein